MVALIKSSINYTMGKMGFYNKQHAFHHG